MGAPARLPCTQSCRQPRPSPSVTGSAFPCCFWQKASGDPATGRVRGYRVWFSPENATNLTESVATARPPLELTLGAAAYRVWVAAYSSLGPGPAATLRIPAAAEEGEGGVPCREGGLGAPGGGAASRVSRPRRARPSAAACAERQAHPSRDTEATRSTCGSFCPSAGSVAGSPRPSASWP